MERGRGKGCQGFWRKNTTRRVEIFSTKPVGLDLYSWWRLAKEAPYLRCPFLIFFGGVPVSRWVICCGVGKYSRKMLAGISSCKIAEVAKCAKVTEIAASVSKIRRKEFELYMDFRKKLNCQTDQTFDFRHSHRYYFWTSYFYLANNYSSK